MRGSVAPEDDPVARPRVGVQVSGGVEVERQLRPIPPELDGRLPPRIRPKGIRRLRPDAASWVDREDAARTARRTSGHQPFARVYGGAREFVVEEVAVHPIRRGCGGRRVAAIEAGVVAGWAGP